LPGLYEETMSGPRRGSNGAGRTIKDRNQKLQRYENIQRFTSICHGERPRKVAPDGVALAAEGVTAKSDFEVISFVVIKSQR